MRLTGDHRSDRHVLLAGLAFPAAATSYKVAAAGATVSAVKRKPAQLVSQPLIVEH